MGPARLRVYLDTSVFGGCFDVEFAAASKRVFDLVADGKLVVVVSAVVVDELVPAPQQVRDMLAGIAAASVEHVELNEAVLSLRDAYFSSGIVRPGSAADATHVAAATVARADAIVSWNFRDLVRLDKIRAYNAVNLLHGYGILAIVSPEEIRVDEPE